MTVWLLTCIGGLVLGILSLILMAFAGKTVFNRVFWLFVLGSVCLFALSGLLSAQAEAFTLAFWILQAITFVLGILYVWLLYALFAWARMDDFRTGFLLALVLVGTGAAASASVYGLLTGPAIFLWQYTLASLFFLLPYLFFQSYVFWTAIPAKRFKRWLYPVNERLPSLEQYKPISIYFHISPAPEQEPSVECLISAPSEKPVGSVFHYLLAQYNAANTDNPIAIYSDESAQKLAGWVFGVESGGQLRIVEPERSFVGNRVAEGAVIMARSFMD